MSQPLEVRSFAMTGHKQPANDDQIQTQDGVEPFPPQNKDDSIDRTGRTEAVTGERRSFDGDHVEPERPGDLAVDQGFTGPKGDPAEGKR